MKTARIGLLLAGAAWLGACTITHKVDASEPIRIELAIKIDQEVRVRLEEDIESLIADNPDLF
jgi:hypothetical protein